MKRRLDAWIARAESLRPREKALLLASAMALLLLAWDSMARAPLAQKLKVATERREALRSEVEGYEATLQTLDQSQQQGDPITVARNDIGKVQKELAGLDEKIRSLTASGVVAPSEMAKALKQVLALNTRLRLVSLRNLKSEPVLLGAAQPAPATSAEGGGAPPVPAAFVYRHAVEIELRGSYMDTVDYVSALEKLPWRLIWNELDIQTETYPQARVRLVISTLSLDPGMIGV